MNHDFIQIKSLEGELKLAHKKRDFGITVSTKELVYQKPHVNYIIKLSDIVTITPYAPEAGGDARRGRRGTPASEWRGASASELNALVTSAHHHRIYVKAATMHSRSGIFPLGATEFILPIVPDMLRAIARYAELEAF